MQNKLYTEKQKELDDQKLKRLTIILLSTCVILALLQPPYNFDIRQGVPVDQFNPWVTLRGLVMWVFVIPIFITIAKEKKWHT